MQTCLSGFRWRRNGSYSTRARSRPPRGPGARPGSTAPGAWPCTGQSELKTGAVSTQVDEKITQFPQNPIFKTASGVWLWARRRNCARGQPQLPSGQGHGGAPRGEARRSPEGAGPHHRQLAGAPPLPSVDTGHVQRTQDKPLVLAHGARGVRLVPIRGDTCPLHSCLCASAPAVPTLAAGRSSRRSPGASRSGMETSHVTRGQTSPEGTRTPLHCPLSTGFQPGPRGGCTWGGADQQVKFTNQADTETTPTRQAGTCSLNPATQTSC